MLQSLIFGMSLIFVRKLSTNTFEVKIGDTLRSYFCIKCRPDQPVQSAQANHGRHIKWHYRWQKVFFEQKYSLGGKCRPWLACLDCTGYLTPFSQREAYNKYFIPCLSPRQPPTHTRKATCCIRPVSGSPQWDGPVTAYQGLTNTNCPTWRGSTTRPLWARGHGTAARTA